MQGDRRTITSQTEKQKTSMGIITATKRIAA
ncbi:MAG: hypothetical protein ACI90V_009713, partial [Bacillariaceae sp.]